MESQKPLIADFINAIDPKRTFGSVLAVAITAF
jgi:hypothetical protein